MLYYTAMNTLVASWSGRLRARIGRVLQWVSRQARADTATPKSTYPKTDEEFNALIAALPKSDLKLKPEVEAEIKKEIEEAEQGIGVSPTFETAEEFIAYLKSDEDSDV